MPKKQELSISSESLQSFYSNFLNKFYIVNRRYQRKLVWTIEEKKSFIDSIINVYPIPLILLAEISGSQEKSLEIIDGLQRLDAITSFINQEFDVGGKYFNLDSMADTKLLKDEGKLNQKNPAMDRKICAQIAKYPLPFSIFQDGTDKEIDEVFRRLNSGGRHLSKQELRQAGNTSKFANIVRRLSSDIRNDSSQKDLIELSLMKKISITNKKLDYGISIDDVFWVKNQIIDKDSLRRSKDEEIIAEIVAWVSLEKAIRSSSDILNELYNFRKNNSKEIFNETNLADNIDLQIIKINEELIRENIRSVFDTLIQIIKVSGKTFNSLIFNKPQLRITRYFQIVFISLYNLLIEQNKTIIDIKKLARSMENIGNKQIRLSEGGGNWSAKEKEGQIDALVGYLSKHFKKGSTKDPASKHWITRLDNLLTQASTEQTLYDFKIGFCGLSEKGKIDFEKTVSKVIKTLTAMANTAPPSIGYCIIGVADGSTAAEQHKKYYSSEYIPSNLTTYYITGVENEAEKFFKDFDDYYINIINNIKKERISERDKSFICENIQTVKYNGKDLIILRLESDKTPSHFEDKYYTRHASSVTEVKGANYATLFKNFQENI